MTYHRQVSIEHAGQSAHVDVGIADLILALWRHGYQTEGSCQSFPEAEGRAMVGFARMDQATMFQHTIGTGTLVPITAEDRSGATEGQNAAACVVFWPKHLSDAIRRVRRPNP